MKSLFLPVCSRITCRAWGLKWYQRFKWGHPCTRKAPYHYAISLSSIMWFLNIEYFQKSIQTKQDESKGEWNCSEERCRAHCEQQIHRHTWNVFKGILELERCFVSFRVPGMEFITWQMQWMFSILNLPLHPWIN